MSEAQHRRPSAWDLAIAALGINLWSTLVLIPALHQSEVGGTRFWTFALLPLGLLAAGAALRNRALLLGGYPLTLLLPAIAEPRLVGVNVFTRWTFLLVAASFLAFTFGVSFLLQTMGAPRPSTDSKPLRPARPSNSQRRRRRMYAALAALATAYPVVLVASLYLDKEVQAAFREHYPERATSAAVLFGALATGIWLLLFHRYFYRPLRAHVRGDRATKADLVVLRHELRRGRPRPQFYLFVTLALVMMVALYLTR